MPFPTWAVSGFLGLPSDWDFLQSEHIVGIDWQAFSWNSLPDWGDQFNFWASRQNNGPSVLIGYSLGGRLALHALLQNPDQYRGAVIISAHPGLSDECDKEKRTKNDRKWAERFANEEWASLMASWNGQEVFSRDPFIFERKEENYQRPHLMRALMQGSLGSQRDLREPISELKIPLLWLTGSKDERYSSLAQNLSFKHPLSRWEQVEGAGHRAPWAKPDEFLKRVHDFLKAL